MKRAAAYLAVVLFCTSILLGGCDTAPLAPEPPYSPPRLVAHECDMGNLLWRRIPCGMAAGPSLYQR